MRDACQYPMDRFWSVQSSRWDQCHSDACARRIICMSSAGERSVLSISSQAALKQLAEKYRCAAASSKGCCRVIGWARVKFGCLNSNIEQGILNGEGRGGARYPIIPELQLSTFLVRYSIFTDWVTCTACRWFGAARSIHASKRTTTIRGNLKVMLWTILSITLLAEPVPGVLNRLL